MNTLDFAGRPEQKQNTEYFIYLVRIAMADDMISLPELELLRRIGKTLGFTNAEAENLIRTTSKSDYSPPAEPSKRFEQVHGIVKMILADGSIDKNEMRSATSFALKSGFREAEIPRLLLLLIDGVKQGLEEKELFDSYNMTRRPIPVTTGVQSPAEAIHP